MSQDFSIPFTYISFNDKDSKEALELISLLRERGYHVENNLSKNPEDCDCFIALLSKDYLESNNDVLLLEEMIKKDKKGILIYLTNINLPKELEENKFKKVYKYKFRDNDKFLLKLFRTNLLDSSYNPNSFSEKIEIEEN